MSIPQALGIQCRLFDQGICGAKGMVNQWLQVPCGVVSNVWSFQLFSSVGDPKVWCSVPTSKLPVSPVVKHGNWASTLHGDMMRKSTNWWIFKPWSWLLGGKVKQMMTILWIRGLPPFPAWSRSCSAKRSWTLRASVSCSSRAFSA